MNTLRCALAWVIIVWYSFPGKLREACGYSRQRTEHYPMLRVFKRFGSYPVTITYPNPLTWQPLTLSLNLCRNTDLWHFRSRARYEAAFIHQARRLLRETKATTFVDVGANIGIWSITLAQAMPNLRVEAVEPISAHLNTLGKNATRPITVHQCVCADKEGVFHFYENPVNNGDGSLWREQVASCSQLQEDSTIPWRIVRGIPLDALLQESSVVKIDVQGAELAVLHGAKESLRDGRMAGFICEVLASQKTAVLEFLEMHPYHIQVIGGPNVYTMIGQRQEAA